MIGSIDVNDGIALSALTQPDRTGTNLVFFDAVDPKPPPGQFPAPLALSYTVTPQFAVAPAQQDPPLALAVTLPIAAAPTQTPQLVSAGIALSPYAPAADYSATSPRQRALWLEFAEPVDDPDDIYFGRVLAYAPDQMLTGAPFDGPPGVDSAAGAAPADRSGVDPADRAGAVGRPRRAGRDAAAGAGRDLQPPFHAAAADGAGERRARTFRLLRLRAAGRAREPVVNRAGPISG